MNLDDQRISTTEITETLAISRERVGYIIPEILDMRKLSAKWVPKCFIAVQKRNQVIASQAILDQFLQNPVDFFNHLVTMDETRIHIMYMIQRPKNYPRNGDTVVPSI
jgi:histone-lysine N-methyltransferase SETMAR